MSSQEDLIRSLNKNKVNNPVFSCYNFSNRKSSPIDSSNVITFYKKYSDIVSEENDSFPTLGEVTENTIPLTSDFIFKFEKDDENKEMDNLLYDNKLIHSLVHCHHKVIKNLINLNSSPVEYICVVCENKSWEEGNLICIKLSLKFPYCLLGKDFIKNIFRNKILTQIRKSKLEKFFIISSPLGDWSSHLQSVKDIYPLYGSSDNSKISPVLFTGVFGENKNGICINIPLDKVYKYKNHHFIKSGKCNKDDIDILETIDDDEDKYHLLLPIFLSSFFHSSIANIKPVEEESSSASSQSDENEERINGDNDFEICLQLIDLLSEGRFEDDNNFLDIGSALHNSTSGGEEGLRHWLRLASDKEKDEDEEYYEECYENFDNSHITIKTLAWYAKKDNYDGYIDWHKRWCLPKIRDCVTSRGSHVPVAEAFYRVYWLDYFFSGGRWYSFRDHTLSSLSEVIPLRNAITNGLIPYFEGFRNQCSDKKATEKGDLAKNLEASLKTINQIIKNLQTEGYRSQIINSSQVFFWKENIYKILNKNPNLLGAKNCVIEINKERAFPRPGKPEDFITKKIGVRYRHNYNWKHKDIKKLLLYFRQIFPNPVINEHMKKDISSFLYRRNAEKKIRVWIGDTNGSKSIYQKIIRVMLGEYYCDLPAEYYSAAQKSNGPSPELAQMENTNVGFSTELDDDMSLKGPRIKKITGGDSFFARKNHQDGGSIETTFKPVLVLNNVPDVSGMDEATKTRFSMVPYEGRWLRPEEIDKLEFELPDDIEEQIKLKTYIMDEKFEDNIPHLANALLWLAVNNYKKYLDEGLKDPVYIQDWMTEYWRKNDAFTAFISERLENPKITVACKKCEDDSCEYCDGTKFVEEIDKEKSLTATELFPEFRRWFIETYPNKKREHIPDKKKFTNIMSNKDKLKPQINRRWWGVALRRINNLEE